jgi:hypothetical protein
LAFLEFHKESYCYFHLKKVRKWALLVPIRNALPKKPLI